MLSNAERQKRYRERAAEALRNSKQQTASASAPPLRLPVYGSELGDETELEAAAWELLDRYVCPSPNRGFPLSTEGADILITLVERDPAGLVDFVRRFVADKAVAFQPKPTKRKTAVT
jgi:hypothetical protein